MKNTTPSTIYIEKVDNLYMHEMALTTGIHLYIEKVENLHIGESELATTLTNQPPRSPHELSARPAFSNSQIVLTCYYVVLSWGIRPRIETNLADLARFIHLLTGIPYKNIDNSDIYRKLQRVPHLKSDRGLIKDLEVVQSLFLQLELKDACLLVEKEIERARQESNKPHKQAHSL